MATTSDSRVIQQEIGDVLEGSPFGITTSDLSSIQNFYQGVEIAFGSFGKVEWNSLDFGYLDQLFSHVLKDILMVEQKKAALKAAVTREIEEILEGFSLPIAFSRLRPVESRYQLSHRKSLDYTSIGVNNIQDLVLELAEQKKVLLLEEPESKDMYVMSVSAAEYLQKHYLKPTVKDLLDKYGGEIALSSFEDFFKDMRMVEWNPLDFGLTDLDQLCHAFKDIVMVEVNSSGEKVMTAANKDSAVQAAAVTREIEKILETCPWGIAMSDLSYIEGSYQLMHGKSLDYEPFGVENIEDLFLQLGRQGKVLLLRRTETDDMYVMSVRLAESQHKANLKVIVEDLLERNGGEINLFSFGHCSVDKFDVDWNPEDYGLDHPYRICDFLKDIVMVEVNSSGEQVIKAVNKDFSGDDLKKQDK